MDRTKISLRIAILLLAAGAHTGCRQILTGEEIANTPVHNFEKLYDDFNAYYGLFEVKQVNWDSLYNEYHPQVTDQTTDEELYDLMVAMLAPLKDNHITLFPTNPSLPRWSNDLEEDGAYEIANYDFEVVKENYLTSYTELKPSFGYGMLGPDIGYVYIQNFSTDGGPAKKDIEKMLAALKDTKGLVLDIRANSGGFDPLAQYIAGRFADSRRLYMTYRKRNGPDRSDFTAPVEWYVEPTGDFQYTKPVVLLTTRATASAAETFTLAMRELPNVTQVGDTSSGAFSDAIMRELYNGWMFTLSIGDYRAANGQSYEGIGLTPDILVQNKNEDIIAGKDEALEKAIEILQ
ncbi:MAG: S41 family peptidase [Lewinellaceae bacterium]|nr:S41 family peptidase [Lewinellaceae bacterium]